MTTKIKILIGILILITVLILGSLISMIIIRPRHGEPYSRVIANMHQIQAKAKMIYEKERSYATLNCNYDDDMKMMCDYIEKKLGLKPTIHQSDKEYCAYIKLNGEEYFCIDSTGFAGKITINLEKENYCDGRTFVCSGEKMKKEEVTITTDKIEYSQGETVKITIENNTNEEKVTIYGFYLIEKFDTDQWKEIKRELCGCGPLMKCEVTYPTLAPNQIIKEEWNQKEEWCKDDELISQQVPSGKYRLKSFIGNAEKWRKGEMKEWEETIYSNEFTLKERGDETANWKTYRNEEYGFEFKYPSDWENPGKSFRGTIFALYFKETHTAPFLEYYPPSSKITFDDFIQGPWGHAPEDIPEEITIDGRKAMKFSYVTLLNGKGKYDPHHHEQVGIRDEKGGFFVINFAIPLEEKEHGTFLFNSFLSTFRFLE